MRWGLRVAVLVLLGAPVVGATQTRDALPQAQPAQANAPLSISGLVVVAGTTPPAPVRRARVTLTSDAGLPARVADTDTDGAFQFDGLPAGTYRLLAEKPGFVPLDTGPPRGVIRPTVITLTPTSAHFNVTMQRASAIEGVLLTDTGEPAASVVVSAVRMQYGAYGRKPSVVRQATTDDLGRFRVHTLPAGDYYLTAPDSAQNLSQRPPADQMSFARSYYPGTARIDEARTVAVASGQDVTNLEFRITSVRMALVSGTVVNSSGRTPSASGVSIQRMGWPPGEVRSVPGRPGTFLFPMVPPGDFWLLASARTGAGGEIEYASTRLAVTGEDMKDLTLTTSKSLSVTGRVESEGNAALPPNLQVLPIETDFELPSPQPAGAPVSPAPGSVGADGTFTLMNLFGNRLFRVDRLPPNWALKSVFVEGTDITDTPVDLASIQGKTLRVVLTNRTASVSGSLEGSASGPTSGRIVVFSEDSRRWGIRSRMIRTVEVLADGRYNVTGLLAGRYFITGVDELDDLAWFDPEVLSGLQATAIPLTLTEGQRVTLTLVRR